jgi:hypothetical protein
MPQPFWLMKAERERGGSIALHPCFVPGRLPYIFRQMRLEPQVNAMDPPLFRTASKSQNGCGLLGNHSP